jgi:KaiC/GvpD/RAD55 family RecA-like ATPase
MPTASISRRNLPPDKPLPKNLEAEKAVLGTILADNRTLKTVSELVNAYDFYHPTIDSLSLNGRIFLAMMALERERRPIDYVTLLEQMKLADPVEVVYVTALGDSMLRVANVKHYASIIRDKSVRRAMIYKTDELQRRAWDGQDTVDELVGELELFVRSTTPARAGHKPIDLPELILMELKARTFILEPILPVKSIAMLYSWRGSGKTFFLLEVTYTIAAGSGNCFCWSVPERRPVLYVDGEMDSTELQERMRAIVGSHDGHVADPGMMRFITPDLEDRAPEIITPDGRRRIEDQLKGGELLILDNLSSLIPSGDERETEDWAIVQEWLLKLRRCGYTTLFAHHAGKGGGQRGTSNREDVLNLVMNLRRPADYSPEEGLRAEVHFEKIRGRVTGEAVQPFEIRLATDEKGHACWTRRPLKELLQKQAYEMLAAGMNNREIADDLKMSRFQVHRLRKKFELSGRVVPGDPAVD